MLKVFGIVGAACETPTAMNLGCGENQLPQFLNVDFEHRWEYPGWIEDAIPKDHFLNHDIREPFPERLHGAFDLVYTEHTLEHLNMDEAAKCVINVKKVMKPSGLLRVVVPDAIFRRNEPPEVFPMPVHQHLTAWTVYSLSWLLENAGFKVHPVKHWNPDATYFSDEDRLRLTQDKYQLPKRVESLIVDGEN